MTFKTVYYSNKLLSTPYSEVQAIFRMKEIQRTSRNSTENERNVKTQCWEIEK